MTKHKKSDHDEALSPLDEEMAEAAPAEQPIPSASAEEMESASIFTEEGTAPLPVLPAEQVDPSALQTEVTELRVRADEYLDGWQRARAEFANYKKRIERDQEEARGRAAAALLAKILPVEDDLRRAVRERPEAEGYPHWADGIELIQRKLAALLEAEGVELIPADGVAFDPALHEAVTYEPSNDHKEGEIIEVIQQGYRLGERVLRPARVRVAR
ncbi:MAG: grpE [Anaerolineales bacterium]|nr:grpE [Anaerolineales bacterium]